MLQMSKKPKLDQYLEEVTNASWCAYLKHDDQGVGTIGVFAETEAAYQAENSYALRALRKRFGYKVQMVIPG